MEGQTCRQVGRQTDTDKTRQSDTQTQVETHAHTNSDLAGLLRVFALLVNHCAFQQ